MTPTKTNPDFTLEELDEIADYVGETRLVDLPIEAEGDSLQGKAVYYVILRGDTEEKDERIATIYPSATEQYDPEIVADVLAGAITMIPQLIEFHLDAHEQIAEERNDMSVVRFFIERLVEALADHEQPPTMQAIISLVQPIAALLEVELPDQPVAAEQADEAVEES